MTTAGQVQLYNTAYRSFELPARRRVRADTYGEDMGQNSWLTNDEWCAGFGCLGLTAESRVLDVARASGRPDLDLARAVGADIVSVDLNPGQPSAARRDGRHRLITCAVTRRAGGLPASATTTREVRRRRVGERGATRRPPGGGLASTTSGRSL